MMCCVSKTSLSKLSNKMNAKTRHRVLIITVETENEAHIVDLTSHNQQP